MFIECERTSFVRIEYRGIFVFVFSESFALILLLTYVAETSLKLKLCPAALLSGRKYMVVENAQRQTSRLY